MHKYNRFISHGEQSKRLFVPLEDFRKLTFVLNKWLHFHVCRKRQLVKESTRISPVSSPPDELCDRTALEDDLTESNILSLDFRTSPFFVLLLAFAFLARSCTMLLYICRANCATTKDQSEYSNKKFPLALCFGSVGPLWIPCRSGVSKYFHLNAWLRRLRWYLCRLEHSEF